VYSAPLCLGLWEQDTVLLLWEKGSMSGVFPRVRISSFFLGKIYIDKKKIISKIQI